MNDNDYADYLASREEDRQADVETAVEQYGPDCGWCGETAVDPVLHGEGMSEDLMCRACAENYDAIPDTDESENFACDYGVGVSDSYLEGPSYPD